MSARVTPVAALRLPFVPDPGNRNLKMRKQTLRREFYGRRSTIPADLRDTTRWKVINHLRTLIAQLSPVAVCLYYPRGAEIDLRSLAEELWRSGQTVCLPRVTYPGHPLTFNVWVPEDTLQPDALGIPAANGPELWPGLLVIPMLGYNRRGYRLGAGGGYYDHTLQKLPVPIATVGVCYTELEIPDFPAEYQDVRLGTIVTGREVILCQ